MEANVLLFRLQQFFPNTPDLMRHLNPGACWKYIIHEKALDNDAPELEYYLRKKENGSVEMLTRAPAEKPDLLLFFTEKAILTLVDGAPAADEYYARYHDVMAKPSPGVDLDNKVNKSKLHLFKMGYKMWQEAFKF
nr:hypothetical protein [Candidatus Sigynarchaeota archaeon]